MTTIAKGIYSLEQKPCGCQIKRYFGGKTIKITCAKHPLVGTYLTMKYALPHQQVDHVLIWFECPSCGEPFLSENELKKHIWEHAY